MTIGRAFGRASHYDDHAGVQREVADMLAATITNLPLKRYASILEIGCGTGFLGEALTGRLADSRWTMTDLSPDMVARAAARLAGCGNIRFATMDGQNPDQSGPFDLICSSLAFQWFPDLPLAVSRLRSLLAPGGWLAFTTLIEGSFSQWRDAHQGLPCGVPAYPSVEALRALGLEVSARPHPMQFASARAFLSHLKGIGAQSPRANYRPANLADMRQIMSNFEASGAQVSYQVATCIARESP